MTQKRTARQLIGQWVAAFNRADADTLESLYAEHAVNHQMPHEPVNGKAAIGRMFRDEFAAAPDMHCIPLQIIEEDDWAVLEWRDPKGFGGCGFFEVKEGLIHTQRGYWDKLTFNKLYHL
ncbi:nuclear transport factor 2 family protein [Taibaiella koreensis]|uniref:nuclear transport factor 2 family protein n=1 Tax=Taibaiella koreensis TaxID=1268548 RepID=UPI000E5A01CB|nr:nuclear transport factor 2 family protein [Taibaiella koreensis]